MQNIVIGSNNVVEVRDLTNSTTGLQVDNASVVCTIKDGNGVTVTGETWPLALNYVGSGTYRGTTSANLNVQPGRWYSVDLVATTPDGHKATWVIPAHAQGDVIY
jgi:hypothetical protein